MLVLTTLLLLLFANIGIDLLFARFKNSAFYISESLLFSSYWLLFFPLLNVQWRLTGKSRIILHGLLFIALLTATHLLCYPAMVWGLSKCFYYHTFSYWQTFEYGLTAYFIKTLIIYNLSLLVIVIYKNTFSNYTIAGGEKEISVPNYLTSIIVSEGNNKKTAVAANEILYFSASSPYVNVHHPSKKYLHSEKLKTLETQLDKHQFVRIHKSYIVNICKVVSYQSRLNGDYDLILTDNTTLRISRNYATVFKAMFEERHRLATK